MTPKAPKPKTHPFDFPVSFGSESPPELLRALEQAGTPKHHAAKDLRFDPFRRAESDSLKQAVGRLRDHLQGQEQRKRRRKDKDQSRYDQAVDAIACNLLVNAMVAPDRKLAIPRSSEVLDSKSRFKPEAYGAHFTLIIDQMRKLGLIGQPQTGYNRHTGNEKAPTLIVPLEPLGAFLPIGTTTWGDFGRVDARGVVVLKAAKSKAANKARPAADAASEAEDRSQAAFESGAWIDYEQTAETAALETEMLEINELLRAADFTLDVGLMEKPVTDAGFVVDPTLRRVRRIFNNGRWDHGGRLYGGFWEIMEKQDRFRALRIEGEPAANVDFGQLFPRLAYAKMGARPTMSDLYAIEDAEVPKSRRAGWKKLLGALFFAEGTLRRFPEGVGAGLSPLKLAEARAAIERRHPAIAPLFGTRVGFEFMHTESRILLAALPRMFAAAIVALPLHDSVLVASSKAEPAKSILEAAYCEITGQDNAVVSIDYH